MTSTKFTPIKDVTIPEVYYRRMKCGIEKLDALFGEGILPGSSITLTARAGLGKTTLVLQMLESLHKNGYKVGYCSSEESVAQLAMTCKRLNVQSISVCNEANVVKGNLSGRELEKYCIEKLVVRAKETECAVILICHNTKAGGIKGSSLIIHAVDVNMSISSIKDAEANARCITFDKNRFGPAIDVECYIEYSGYDFQTQVVVDEQAATGSKSKKKHDQREAILKLKDITLPNVCKQLSIDSTRAGFLLRELQNEGKLCKEGRGVDASWVKSELNVTVVES